MSSNPDHEGRTPMALGVGYGVVWVRDEQVDDMKQAGWFKVNRRSVSASTGPVPTQRQSGN